MCESRNIRYNSLNSQIVENSEIMDSEIFFFPVVGEKGLVEQPAESLS